jgi:hypothetical protein
MPAKPTWLMHIAEIQAMLEEVDLPVIDRAVVQRVFGLGRRQAIELLNRFGGYRAGNTFLIERSRLIAELDKIAGTGECQREVARREKLESAVAEVQSTRRAHQVRLPVSPDVFGARMCTLGEAIRLVPGKLEVEFTGTEDLLSKLFALAQAAAHDYDGFESASGGGG